MKHICNVKEESKDVGLFPNNVVLMLLLPSEDRPLVGADATADATEEAMVIAVFFCVGRFISTHTAFICACHYICMLMSSLCTVVQQ